MMLEKKVGAAIGASLLLAACGGSEEANEPMEAATETPAAEDMDMADEGSDMGDAMDDAMAPMTIADAVANEEIRGDRMARDGARNPAETLAFFGLESDMVVVEALPGGGWYTDIIAPFLASGGGTFYAGHFAIDSESERRQQAAATYMSRYAEDPEIFGDVRMTTIPTTGGDAVADGSVDMVLTFRSFHGWRGAGVVDEVFADFYRVLKPGAVLGVVQHRLPEDREVGDEMIGYVKQSEVVAAAEAAGFTLDAASEINANPNDTADHPYGVWTLPPVSRTPREGEEAPEGWDPERYLAIGESDRMTLRFVKPAADAALLE